MHNDEKNASRAFAAETQKFIGRLEQFGALLKEAKSKAISSALDESFSKSLKKVEALMEDVRSGKLKISLVGAFSDGKTSTVAGFLGHADPSMKIAEEESSDEIVEYTPQNIDADVPPCVFVDTPGLFGRKFSNKTEEWISQAHVIIYVVSAVNPLKDSHKFTIEWLLEKLKKFDNSVFVINMMDKVCDYTDIDDFTEQKEEKTRFLKGNVARFCGIALDDVRMEHLNIVCIAADPDGRGLQSDDRGHENYWLTDDRRVKYERYSHMQDLRDAVADIIRATLAERLISSSALAAVKEETRKNCEELTNEASKLTDAVIPEVERTINTLKTDLADARKDFRREKRPCREELLSLENDICEKIRNVTMEEFNALYEDELGGSGDDAGYKLLGRINDILTDHFASLMEGIVNRINGDFEAGVSHIDTALRMMRKGAKTISSMTKSVDRAMVFVGRDLLGKLGVVIKFKPWQAVKIAKFAGKGLPVIGTIVSFVADIWRMVTDAKAQRRFNDMKDNLRKEIHNTFNDIYKDFNEDEKFFARFAPQIAEIETQIAGADKRLAELRGMEKYCQELDVKLKSFWEVPME